jgi:hypothetical protein
MPPSGTILYNEANCRAAHLTRGTSCAGQKGNGRGKLQSSKIYELIAVYSPPTFARIDEL